MNGHRRDWSALIVAGTPFRVHRCGFGIYPSRCGGSQAGWAHADLSVAADDVAGRNLIWFGWTRPGRPAFGSDDFGPGNIGPDRVEIRLALTVPGSVASSQGDR